MRRATILSLVFSVAAACSAPPGVRARRPAPRDSMAVDSLPRSPAVVDLTGVWATGSGAGEPDAQRIVIHLECNYTPPFWVIEQRGDTVRAWTNPESRAQGIRAPERVAPTPAEGWISGVDVTMSGGGSRYVLHYDPASGHLRGTLNGVPFWAVREETVRPDNCIPVP